MRTLCAGRGAWRRVCAAAVLLASGVCAAGQDADGGAPTFNGLNSLAHEALGARKYVEAERLFRQADGLAGRDTLARAIVQEGLAGVYSRRGELAKATAAAQRAWRLRPAAGTLATMVDVAMAAGDLGSARRLIRYAGSHADRFRDGQDRLRELRAKLSVQVYRMTYHVQADRWPEWKTVFMYPPVNGIASQKVLKETVEGAANWVAKRDREGGRYLEMVRVPGQDIRVTVELEQRPVSYRGELSRWKAVPLPDEVKPYLGRTVGLDPLDVIDPTTPVVKGILAKLIGKTDVETTENIMRWCADNLLNPPVGMRNAEPSDVVLVKRGGHCAHYAAGFAALMRGAGIPARMYRGHSCVFSPTVGAVQHPLQHTSPMFYLRGIGWIEFRWADGPWCVPIGYVARVWGGLGAEPGDKYDITDGCEAIGPVVNGKPTYKFEQLHTFELLSQRLEFPEEGEADPDAPDSDASPAVPAVPTLLPLADGLPGWALRRGERPVVRMQPDGARCLTTESAGAGGENVCEMASPAFALSGERLTLMVAGCSRTYPTGVPESYVGLEVDGETVLRACGQGDTALREVVWEVARWKGKQARIVVVDRSRGGRAPYVMLGPVRWAEPGK